MHRPDFTLEIARLSRLVIQACRLTFLVAMAGTTLANGTVGKVFVYNGGADNGGKRGDLFANAAQGWIFDQMGLLGPNGQPPTVDGNNLRQGATAVGAVIRDAGGKIIGYESADGKSRAYNVDTSATTLLAWNALSATGEFIIAKHGTRGGITLDDGKMYSGFKPAGAAAGGTGLPTAQGPYGLPPKPGGTVRFYANSCYSADDPAGAVGSVTGSAAGIGGVVGTQGNADLIYKGTWLFWTGGTNAQRAAATARMKAVAKAAGFTGSDGQGDAGKWLASLPFAEQYSTITTKIAGTGASFRLQYTKSPNAGWPGNAGAYYTAVESVDQAGALLDHQNGPGQPFLELEIPFDALLGGPKTVQLMPGLPEDPQIPRGSEPASYFGALHQYGLDEQLAFDPANPARLRMSFDPNAQVTGVFEVLANGALQLVPANVQPGFAEVQVAANGVWVVLQDALGTIYCVANQNSTGQTGRLDASGSDRVSENDVVLTASQLPPNVFGFVVAGPVQGFVPNAGGSMGNLCILPPIGRGVGDVIFNTGADGTAVVEADLLNMPTPNGPVGVQPGDTWNFQVWHRDTTATGQSTSNFTDAVSILFQ